MLCDNIGALTNFGLFFPVTCFIFILDQVLEEQPYRGKRLYELCHNSWQLNVVRQHCVTKMSHLLILLCSFQWCVSFFIFDQVSEEQPYRGKRLYELCHNSMWCDKSVWPKNGEHTHFGLFF